MFPDSSLDTARNIDGVEAIGRYTVVEQQLVGVTSGYANESHVSAHVNVVGISSGVLEAVSATVVGSSFTEVSFGPVANVALVGQGVADSLGGAAIGDRLVIGRGVFEVVGILSDVRRLPELQLSILVPERALTDSFSANSQRRSTTAVVVATRPGAAQVVARQLAVALDPASPDAVTVVSPPEIGTLRAGISRDVQLLALGAAIVTLVGGAIAVANLTALSIMQRTGEFGLRMAMGASRLNVVAQVLIETAMVGIVAGTVGSVIAAWIMLEIAIVNRWAPVFELLVLVEGVGVGLASGFIGGAFPAYLASRANPADALRSE